MSLFVEANIIIATLKKEYPLFTWSSRLMSLHGKRNIELFTSPLCLAIAFYFSSKKSGENLARKKIEILCQYIGITTIEEKITDLSIKNKLTHDFEDGLEYYSVLQHNCDWIVTEKREDFYFSDIEVMGCEDFLLRLQEANK
jgi:hypothetical protein